MLFRYSLLVVYTVPSVLSLSLFLYSAYKCLCASEWTAAVPYNTSQVRFPPHLVATSNSSPIHVRLLQQVCSSCFVCTLSASSILFVHVFPSFLPSYSDWVWASVSFLSLSQFYGCWNPRAPVFIVSLFLLLTQRHSGASMCGWSVPKQWYCHWQRFFHIYKHC